MDLVSFQREIIEHSRPFAPRFAVGDPTILSRLIEEVLGQSTHVVPLQALKGERVYVLFGVTLEPDSKTEGVKFAYKRACSHCGASDVPGNRDSTGACKSCGSLDVRYHYCRKIRGL